MPLGHRALDARLGPRWASRAARVAGRDRERDLPVVRPRAGARRRARAPPPAARCRAASGSRGEGGEGAARPRRGGGGPRAWRSATRSLPGAAAAQPPPASPAPPGGRAPHLRFSSLEDVEVLDEVVQRHLGVDLAPVPAERRARRRHCPDGAREGGDVAVLLRLLDDVVVPAARRDRPDLAPAARGCWNRPCGCSSSTCMRRAYCASVSPWAPAQVPVGLASGPGRRSPRRPSSAARPTRARCAPRPRSPCRRRGWR